MSPLRRRDIPNALTLLRLGLAAATIGLLSAWPGPTGAALDLVLLGGAALFAIAAITDAVDGYLARKWSAISVFGRIMDPFADKILVLGTLIVLSGGAFAAAEPTGGPLSGFAGWMVALILARELLVTSIRGAFESRGVDFSATGSGKLKMAMQSGAVPVILAILAFSGGAPGRTGALAIDTLAWLTTIVTAWSAIPYIARARRIGRMKA